MKRTILTLALCLSLCASNLPAISVSASDSVLDTTSSSTSCEKKRYIVVFKDKPVSASIKKYAKKAKKLEKKAFKTQNVSVKKIEKITDTKVRNQNTFLVNFCSIDATYEEAMKIKKLDTVADCYEAFAYTPNMEQAAELCDVTDAWWDKTMPLDGKGTVISIIDTGVNFNHIDLIANSKNIGKENFKYSIEEMQEKIKELGYGRCYNYKVPFAYNYAEKCEAKSDNLHYHGTHVAGIASAYSTWNNGVKGVAYNSQILSMQVYPGSGKSAFTDDIVQAIEDSVKLGADVINLSLGTRSGYTDYDSIEVKAVNAAYNSGCIIAAAAGNERNSSSDSLTGYNNPYNLLDTGIVDNPGSFSNTLTVAACEDIAYKTDNVKMFEKSSWGPTPELELKPEITAPGVNIKSLGTETRFQTLSGTSMATPFISGVSALVKQSIDVKGLNLTGSSLSNYIKNTIINTASPLIDYTYAKGSVPYSVRQQGSGLVNAKNAVDNNVIATYNGDATIELRNINEGTTSIPIKIQLTNYGKTDEKYSLSDCPLYTETSDPDKYADSYLAKGPCFLKKIDNSYIHFNSNTVTVKAGETTTVSAYVILSKDIKPNNYIEGFVSLNGNISLNLPLLGFYGNWDMLPIFDEPTGSSNCIMDKYKYGPSVYVTDKDDKILGKINDNFDIKHSAISLDPNSNNNIAIPCLTRLRNAYRVDVSVVDNNDNLIQNIGTYTYLRKSSFSPNNAARPLPITSNSFDFAQWDGTRYDEKAQETVPVEDGQYYFIVKAKHTKNAPYQTVKIPIIVDSTAPEIDVKFEYNRAEDMIIFDVLAKDNFEFVPDITFRVNDYLFEKKVTFNYLTDGTLLDNGYRRFTLKDVQLISDYIDVKIQDYAKNVHRKLILGDFGLIDETEENSQQNPNQNTKDTLGPVVDIIASSNLSQIKYYSISGNNYGYIAQKIISNNNIEFTFKVTDQGKISERYKPLFRINTRTKIDNVISVSSIDLDVNKIDDSTYKVVITPEDLEHTWDDIDTPKKIFTADFSIYDEHLNETRIKFNIYPSNDGPENYRQQNVTHIKPDIPEQCIIKNGMLNSDNTYTINLNVTGIDFDSATINDIKAEMIYPENYEYMNIPSRLIKLKADIPLKVGKNYYTVRLYKTDTITQEKKLVYQQSCGTILYNGDNISYDIKSNSPLKNDIYMCYGDTFDFNLDVNSKLNALNVSINNSVIYSYNEIHTNCNRVSLPLSYKLKGKEVNTLKIKVTDLCGNEAEKIIKAQNVKVYKAPPASTNVIKNIKDTQIKLKSKKVYTGKKIKPIIIIKDVNTKLQKNIDYKLTYKNNKKIGKAKVIIEGIGNYTGTVRKTFKIVPGKSNIKKISKYNKGKISLKAKKLKYKVKYEFFYSTKKKGKYKKLGISKRAILKTHKLKCNKKYFIKVRTFKKVMGTKYSSSFSKAKKVIIKK